jgi:hypothetical protein
MKKITFLFITILFCSCKLNAQFAANQIDIAVQIDITGEARANYTLTFDAEAWRQWKNSIGSDADRVRANVRYIGGAHTQIDEFKYERDDLNREAKMMIHSKVASLYRDGRYHFDIDEGYRLIDTNGPVWFFSGKTGIVPGTIKITLPVGAIDAKLDDAGNNQKEISYIIPPKPGSAMRFRNFAIGFIVMAIVLFALERALYGSKINSLASSSVK